MKGLRGLIYLSLFSVLLASFGASATKVPLPSDKSSLNVTIQIQPQFWVIENGSPDGKSAAYDMMLRRIRLLVNGDISDNFQYFFQIDEPNLGRRGDIPGPRVQIQDAFVTWAPLGTKGGTAVFVDGGFLILPTSRHMLQSTSSHITADTHTDGFRGIVNTFAFRDTGFQVRGWLLDKKIGFRVGAYEGARGFTGGTTPVTLVNPNSTPRLGAYLNVDLIGTEEGGYLYHGIYFTEKPIVSVGGSVVYQSRSLVGPVGITDARVFSAAAFIDWPLVFGTQAAEAVLQVQGYRNDNGRGSSLTGWGGHVDLGVRFGPIMPYASYEAFEGDSCPSDVTAAQCAVTAASAAASGTTSLAAQTQNTRSIRAGVDFFINKNLNHIKAEFASNRGVSAQSQTSQITNTLNQNNKSVLVHWNVIF